MASGSRGKPGLMHGEPAQTVRPRGIGAKQHAGAPRGVTAQDMLILDIPRENVGWIEMEDFDIGDPDSEWVGRRCACAIRRRDPTDDRRARQAAEQIADYLLNGTKTHAINGDKI